MLPIGRLGVNNFLESKRVDRDFQHYVSLWAFRLENGTPKPDPTYAQRYPHRRALLLLLEQGLQGQSILDKLIDLEREIEVACEIEVKEDLEILPLKLLFPLLVLQFPAFLLLLVGPLTQKFLNALRF